MSEIISEKMQQDAEEGARLVNTAGRLEPNIPLRFPHDIGALEHLISASIAISLKRIADSLHDIDASLGMIAGCKSPLP